MGKLTTLEGDFDFYGSVAQADEYLPSFFGADEVMVGGFSIGKTLRKSTSVAKKATRAVANAPLKVATAVVKAPVQVAKIVKAPKAVVKAVSAITYAPRKLIEGATSLQKAVTNPIIGTAFSVPEVAYNRAISPVADVAMRNPLATAYITGGASLIPQMMSKQGRSALLGKKSTLQKTGRFIQRHPYLTAIPTGGASLIAASATKRGRQALAGKKPGYRTARGLTGVEKDEYLALKNKKRNEKEQARLDELSKKGVDAIEATKAEKAEAAANKAVAVGPSAAQSGGGGGGSSSGGGSSGGGSAPEVAPEEEKKASPLGGILLAAGVGALMLL